MPKVTKQELAELETDTLLMGENEETEYEVEIADNGKSFTFGRELKYVYPEWANTPELRQKFRRQERRAKRRAESGKEPFVRGPKKSDAQLRQARKARREVRTAVKDKAISLLAQQQGVSYEEMVLILKDSVING